jgi:hypothetical protein
MKSPFPPSPKEHGRAVDYIKGLNKKSNETEMESVISAMQGSYHLAWMFAILFAVSVGSSFWLAAFMFLMSLGYFWNGMRLGQLLELFDKGELVDRNVNQTTQTTQVTRP